MKINYVTLPLMLSLLTGLTIAGSRTRAPRISSSVRAPKARTLKPPRVKAPKPAYRVQTNRPSKPR